MEKPLCKLCRRKHLSGEPHVFGGEEPAAAPLAPVAGEDEVAVAPQRQAQGRDMERYRAYQREYHRRYRAARKGSLT